MKALRARMSGQSGGTQDLALAAGVITMIAILLVPLPAWALDFGFALSIVASILILMAALMLEKPLQLSAFPTILLIVTMFRLSLNIASTRLILTDGHQGGHAAGDVIAAFGSFLMGGNAAIGITIFLILVLINFIVITKGAGRIAEVAARFSLDAMPGKQMAVDADLNSGLIDEKEARRRRDELEAESNFYGAMDGASKFVRGDAVAGLIITAINIVMGIAIGILSHGLSVGDAFGLYTLMTIGDGLVTQFPALVISLAAGILVSKGGVRGKAEAAIGEQLARHPKALFVGAFVMLLLGVIPGVPFAPFGLLAAGCGYLGWRLSDKAEAARLLAVREEEVEAQRAVEEAPQTFIAIEPLVIELGVGLVPAVNDPVGDPRLIDQIKSIRNSFIKDFGFVMPHVRIVDDMQLNRNQYVIRCRDIVVGQGIIHLDKLMALGADVKRIAGEDAIEPVFGLPVRWIDRTLRDEAEFNGLNVIAAPTVIATHLTEVVKNNFAILFDYGDLQDIVASLPAPQQKLYGEIVPSKMTHIQVTSVLRNLLSERVSIRDFGMILNGLAEASAWTSSVNALTEHVRMKLARQISTYWARREPGATTDKISVITLAPSYEQKLCQHLAGDYGDQYLTIDPMQMRALIETMSEVHRSTVRYDCDPVFMVPPSLRSSLVPLMRRAAPSSAVISTAEIDPAVRIETVGVVTDKSS